MHAIVSEICRKYRVNELSIVFFRTGTQNSSLIKGQVLCSQHLEVKLFSVLYTTTFNKEFVNE